MEIIEKWNQVEFFLKKIDFLIPSKTVGPRLRSIASLVEDPLNEPVTGIRRRVIGAANLLDSVSTITGKFLTHSPIARLIVISYLVFLHLWVLYVFITFKPEIHSDDFKVQNY